MALAPFRSDRIPFAGSDLQQIYLAASAPNLLMKSSSSFLQTKKTCLFRQVFKTVGERGLPCSASSALRAVAEATLSRYARLKPPSKVLILFSADEKKPVFSDRFLKWSAREDYPALRAAPFGPLLKQRCLATLGSNLLRRSSSSFLQTKKNLSFQTGF
jgi:hypothetical protein